MLRRILRKLPPRVRRFARALWLGPGIFAEQYILADNSHVTLYTDNATIQPAYRPRTSLRPYLLERGVRVTLIASARQEAIDTEEWVACILRQTRLPDEIIVVDGGSTDGTAERLQTLAQRSPIRFLVLVEPGANIAQARNVAIHQAQYPIIAVTDFGCRPRADWLEHLIAPFEGSAEIQVAAGMYATVDRDGATAWKGYSICPEPVRINPQNFVPSSRSIAFRREMWHEVGGYPEWLTLTGEDTYFDRELKRIGGEWAFVPEAVVEWHAPYNHRQYCRKVYNWAAGDGESGLHASFYWRYVLQLSFVASGTLALVLLAAILLAAQVSPTAFWLSLIALTWLAGLWFTSRVNNVNAERIFFELALQLFQIAGFVAGARLRSQILLKRLAATRGMFFILSGVPIDDTGGGARCTQIALELLQQGYAVVFIHRFPRYESVRLNLRIGHPNLFHYDLAEFDWHKFAQAEGQQLEGKFLAALIEFPLREFLPLLRKIREHGGIVIYDLIDAWNTSLGGKWYDLETEIEIAQISQHLIATVPSLAERLKQMTGREVALLPNAVNVRLFDPERHYERPPDMPEAEWIAMYTGALWGEWFDWDLLVEIARQYPEAAIVVIGDYRGQCIRPPVNLHFLGLKAQKELPAYLSYADVAMVPWKASRITDAVSPLKVYEYLAMRLPIVAPTIVPLQGLPGVWLAQGSAEFVAKLAEARHSIFPATQVADFIRVNNWQVRVNDLRDLAKTLSK